ncbi:2-methylaconitate cis-trans isomerase PrpF [Halomonas sp. HNIBRBA4712]|uniref:2-methylaconitate cis-trans isomerase PrpF n=1 Tax=Halomonas sp. HNIBRBA4712 TaxID=3373087 RepID=UPI003744E255
MKQRPIPATYMRGGTSKGVFFLKSDLPEDARERDALLLRVIGSPDPYQKQIDGMGGATSSTSKVVVISPSERDDCDVDYLFGAVSVEEPVIDWSGNCGNLTSAVGPFAIQKGLVDAPSEGNATVRIWQANIEKHIHAIVPMEDGEVQELGDFQLDGVTFPAGEIVLEFLSPAGGDGKPLFPTGNPVDTLDLEGFEGVQATLLDAGNPTIIVDASSLGLTGCEIGDQVNGDAALLARCEAIRAHCAVLMGLAKTADEATRNRPHTPKLAFIAAPQDYQASSGKNVAANDIDLVVRILSMGKLHHAITGTGALAIAAAIAVEGTLARALTGDLGSRQASLGHASGIVEVGATASHDGNAWQIDKAIMSRSARRLMEGAVLV